MSASRIAVIGGGVSCEHSVSLASATSVAEALASRGYRIDLFVIGRDGLWSINGGPSMPMAAAILELTSCGAIFPVMHGRVGEDGTIAAVCEMIGRPYVGSGVMAGALAMDKWATKCVVSALGYRTAPGVLLTRPAEVAWNGPVVIKPVATGSSYGVALVRDKDALGCAIEDAFRWDRRVLVEEYIDGRELDIAVWPDGEGGHATGPVLEIVRAGIFDTETKYSGRAQFTVPADVSAKAERELSRAALTIFDALGCSGIVRADFFLVGDVIVFNEINTTPGLTPHSQVPRMYEASGGVYADLLETALLAAAPDVASERPMRQ